MNNEAAGVDRTPASSQQKNDKTIERKVVVLLAEDNRVDVMLIKEAIETYRLPIELHLANDGEEACEIIEAADADLASPCPELLVLDLNLPRRSGIEILERLRSSAKCKDIPVLVVTSSDLSRERDELAKLGVWRHFRKPTGYDDYLKIGEVLNELLKESQLI